MLKLKSEFTRIFMNWVPCIRGGGGHVSYLKEDYTQLIVTLPFNWRTRNIVNTIYGGSLYASTDPFYMLMLSKILGKSFVVWDKGCTIHFKRPAKTTVFAEFHVTPEMLADVRREVAAQGEATFTWTIEYKDKAGVVYTTFDKVLYVATKEFYDEKQRKRRETAATMLPHQ